MSMKRMIAVKTDARKRIGLRPHIVPDWNITTDGAGNQNFIGLDATVNGGAANDAGYEHNRRAA